VAVGAGLLVAVAPREVVLGELEDDGEEGEQLSDDGVVDVAREGLDLVGVLVDDGRVRAGEVRGELGNVVDLGVVEDARTDLLLAVSGLFCDNSAEEG
jgi:hypothetical protein